MNTRTYLTDMRMSFFAVLLYRFGASPHFGDFRPQPLCLLPEFVSVEEGYAAVEEIGVGVNVAGEGCEHLMALLGLDHRDLIDVVQRGVAEAASRRRQHVTRVVHFARFVLGGGGVFGECRIQVPGYLIEIPFRVLHLLHVLSQQLLHNLLKPLHRAVKRHILKFHHFVQRLKRKRYIVYV